MPEDALNVACATKHGHDSDGINIGLVHDQVGIKREEQNRPSREILPFMPLARHSSQSFKNAVKFSFDPVGQRDTIFSQSTARFGRCRYWLPERRDSRSRVLLLEGGQTFTAFKLAKGPLDFLMDDLPVIGEQSFFFVEHLNGSLNELINGLIRAALQIHLDQGLDLRLEVNGHRL
jgi:hypothetical protein